jgi:hypothetical protein
MNGRKVMNYERKKNNQTKVLQTYTIAMEKTIGLKKKKLVVN